MIKENRIGSERVRMGLSQLELSKILGISNKTLSAWEANPSSCPTDRLVELSKHFDCSVDYLLGRTNERVIRRHA